MNRGEKRKSMYKNKEKMKGNREITGVKRRWVSLTKIIFKASPIKSYGPEVPLYKLYRFLVHPVFQGFITVTVILNGLLCCLHMYRLSDYLNNIFEGCYLAFLGIYAFEVILKIFFYRKDYFNDGWQIYNLFIVFCLSMFYVLKNCADIEIAGMMINIFWTLKLFVLFSKLKVLHSVFEIFILALPSVINLALLVLLMMYIFATIGVCIFSSIKLQSNLNEQANFQNLLTAFITIFRFSTYDGWNDLMHDAMRVQSTHYYCIYNPTYQDVLANNGNAIGCGSPYASIYFVLFILIIPFMFLNIFVAIVVASVIEIAQLSESVLSDERLNILLKVWAKYDPNGTGYLEYDKVWNILYDIPEPLGASSKDMSNRYYCAITLWMLQLSLYRKEDNGYHYVAFYDVVESLVKRCLYKPQTLNKIYNNLTKEMLIKGLQELWDQRTQLAMDSDMYLNTIEDLHYYYELKRNTVLKSKYKLIKVNLPLLVWIILKISMGLRNRINMKKRKNLVNIGIINNNISNQTTAIKDNDTIKEFNTEFSSNDVVEEFFRRSITKEVDNLSISTFGELKPDHNVPLFSYKMKANTKNKDK